ncbi:MAG TPA: sialidase family protein [Polyangia bacterium]|nr:sialidase family protein [Polyangia bacterium]
MPMRGLGRTSVVGPSVVLLLLAHGCGEAPGFLVEASLARDVPPQFLSVPVRPRSAQLLADPNRFDVHPVVDGHYVWRPSLIKGTAAPTGARLPTADTLDGEVAVAAPQVIPVSRDPAAYQSETAAAANGAVLVAGSNSLQYGPFPDNCVAEPCRARAYTSTDGTNYTTTILPGTWNEVSFNLTFDPAIDFDTYGNFYFSMGALRLPADYPNSIAVSRAGPSGLGWAPPSAVTFNDSRYFDDKPWIAIDRSGSIYRDRIYVGWDRNHNNNQILYLSYSSNGGASWSPPIKVNDGKTGSERVFGAAPAVDHNNGTVYLGWLDYAANILYVDRSTSGGQTWGTDVAAAPTHTRFGVVIPCVGGRSQGPAHHLQVGPSGTLHLVYADSIADRGLDILYARSTDGGRSWSAPVRVNDDAGGGHQFHPMLSVTAGRGGDQVAVSFYDRRDDANNCLSHVYATTSADGGRSWSPNVRLTTVASSFDGDSDGPGDYSSSAPFGRSTYPFFTDHSTADFDIYAAPF